MVEIVIKTLEGSFVHNVPPATTIKELQHLIHPSLVNICAEKQKLIHAGELLANEALTINEAGISDGDSVIILAKRERPPPPPVDTTAVPRRESIAAALPDIATLSGARNGILNMADVAASVSDAASSITSVENQLQNLLDAVAGLNGINHFRHDIETVDEAVASDHHPERPTTMEPEEALAVEAVSVSDLVVAREGTEAGASEAEAGEAVARQAGAGEAGGRESGADDTGAGAAMDPVAEALANVQTGDLQTLLEMGFPEERARKALVLHHNHCPAAMEWLLQVSDEEADAALPPQFASLPPGVSAHTLQGAGSSERDSLESLVEMGFEREQAEEALRLCHNNQELACEWLCTEEGADRDRVARRAGGLGAIQAGNADRARLLELLARHPSLSSNMHQSEAVRAAFQSFMNSTRSTQDFLDDPEERRWYPSVWYLLARQQRWY
ncbi:hypothetical protein CYMTET_40085 [Cymbomonas tetramitiformis]|uniref:UV excision repair protein RAD23 n=1 Tax=Cymbomonas tetramitiformis TaxID=36881 RepID=A0AAE0F402_9CHLO|nr:hypothetical protein CYMTET_40085 [Cymbomonas tetramitiformis]